MRSSTASLAYYPPEEPDHLGNVSILISGVSHCFDGVTSLHYTSVLHVISNYGLRTKTGVTVDNDQGEPMH